MPKSPVSIIRKLETSGYLSLAQFVDYLKLNAPEASVSYPTALKLVNSGKIQGRKVGGVCRIGRREIERWVSEGNYDRMTYDPYPKDPSRLR